MREERRESERGQTHIGLSSLAPRDSLKVANITRDLQIVTQLGATTGTVGSSEGEEQREARGKVEVNHRRKESKKRLDKKKMKTRQGDREERRARRG